MKHINKFFICALFLNLCACQTQPPIRPEIVPAVEIKQPETKKHSLGIIGQVEPIYILPMKTPFFARIDTGAENSSIGAKNIKTFERDGEKWVSFELINRTSGEKHTFEEKIKRVVEIKRIHKDEKRFSVMLNIKIGNEIINDVKFTLAERSKFDYQALVGRNILTGRAIVDTELSKTLN